MAQLTTQDDYIKTALRLPKDVHAHIQEAATGNGRSMNAEIVARLQESFASREPATVRINLVAGEETKMKDIRAALELLKPGISADQGIELVVAQVQKG